jgi:hypothetical protein
LGIQTVTYLLHKDLCKFRDRKCRIYSVCFSIWFECNILTQKVLCEFENFQWSTRIFLYNGLFCSVRSSLELCKSGTKPPYKNVILVLTMGSIICYNTVRSSLGPCKSGTKPPYKNVILVLTMGSIICLRAYACFLAV